jgi:beta-carotene 3-hydroxylase
VRSVVIAVLAFVAMEPITALTHRVVMHGAGKPLHRSHHRRVRPGEREQRWEANDLFPLMFAALVMIGLAVGFNVRGWDVLVPIGVGVTCYGSAYAVVHDVYTHHRLRLFGDRSVPVLERLARKHREHHTHGGAPYGMLVPVSARGSRPSHDPLDA